MQLRLAEIHDAGAITGVINAAFKVAESFLIDRDRIDEESVRALRFEVNGRGRGVLHQGRVPVYGSADR